MTVSLPDTSEMVKDGRLTPVAIQFFDELTQAINQLKSDVNEEGGGIFDADTISFIDGLQSTSLTPHGITLKGNSYFDTDGAGHGYWTELKAETSGGANWTSIRVYHRRRAATETMEEIYLQQKQILARIDELESALVNIGIIEVI